MLSLFSSYLIVVDVVVATGVVVVVAVKFEIVVFRDVFFVSCICISDYTMHQNFKADQSKIILK